MKGLSLLLIFLQTVPLHAAGTPVGIARWGESAAADEKAFSLVEKRLQRWVENNDSFQLEVKPFSKFLREEDLMGEVNQLHFGQLVTQIKAELPGLSATESGKISPKIAQMRELRRKVELIPDAIAMVYRSYFWEARYDWLKKDKKSAQKHLYQAARLHPEAILPSNLNWENMDRENKDSAGFEILVDRAVGAQVRGCRILIQNPNREKKTPADLVTVNGFGLGRKKELHLNSGMFYRISKGLEYEPALVRCERQSNQKVLLPTKKIAASKAAQILKKQNVVSTFLVQQKKSDFNISLFTPGIGFHTLPLDKPLKKREVLQNPTEEGIPVSKQAVLKVLETHGLQSVKMRSLLPVGHPNPPMLSHLDHKVEERKKWYNHWAFWAITGTVLAGASIAYFASRNNGGGVDVSKSQINVGLE